MGPRRRREIYERDRYRCRYCGAPADTIDHVIPRSKGGTHRAGNLVAACAPCNRRKGNLDLADCGLTLVPLEQHRKLFPRRRDPPAHIMVAHHDPRVPGFEDWWRP